MAFNSLSTKVGLRISCVGLKKTDMMSKSDPFVVCYIKDPKNVAATWKEFSRTTTLENTQNPEWSDQILIQYQFEAMQYLRFEVYDRDSKSENLSAHDFLGAFETSMSRIMGSIGCTTSGLLEVKGKTKKRGKIVISGQEVNSCADVAVFKFKASKLERKNMMGLGKSDPFYEIHQAQGDGKFYKVFTSEVLKGNVNPVWKEQSVPVQVLSNGVTDRDLRFDIYDWESSGKHKFIGSFSSTLDNFKTTKQFVLTNPNAKKAKDKTKSRGIFEVVNFQINNLPSFLDYIQGGLELNLMIAIDFTGSNGLPTNSTSLHYMKQGFEYNEASENIENFNQYQLATWSVGRILQDYDEDKKIPAYGFGGFYNNQTSHCFPLNFDESNPEVDQIKGVMEVYKLALMACKLSGPTLFNKVLEKSVGFAEELSSEKTKQKYEILLILTDGVINDMPATIERLIQGSNLPMSVIIVGVGHANFDQMEALDSDGKMLSINGKKASRDLVQFVPFNEFFKRGPTILAEEVLKEVPGQVVEYFHKIKKQGPLPPQEPPKTHYMDFDEDEDEEIEVTVVDPATLTQPVAVAQAVPSKEL